MSGETKKLASAAGEIKNGINPSGRQKEQIPQIQRDPIYSRARIRLQIQQIQQINI
jgi:hypothetical protein